MQQLVIQHHSHATAYESASLTCHSLWIGHHSHATACESASFTSHSLWIGNHSHATACESASLIHKSLWISQYHSHTTSCESVSYNCHSLCISILQMPQFLNKHHTYTKLVKQRHSCTTAFNSPLLRYSNHSLQLSITKHHHSWLTCTFSQCLYRIPLILQVA